MSKWVRFSRDVRIRGEYYSSRTWYQVSNGDAKEFEQDFYGAIRVEDARPPEEVVAGILDLEAEALEEVVEELKIEEPKPAEKKKKSAKVEEPKIDA